MLGDPHYDGSSDDNLIPLVHARDQGRLLPEREYQEERGSWASNASLARFYFAWVGTWTRKLATYTVTGSWNWD